MGDEQLPSRLHIEVALLKGRFLLPTANLLAEIGLGFEGYDDKTKQYRLHSARFPSLFARILQDKDIPKRLGWRECLMSSLASGFGGET